MTYDDSSTTEYLYDLAGRVTTITDSVSGQISYTYSDYGCGSCTGSAMDRIASETTPAGTIDYTYDAVGRRISMTLYGAPVVNYTYDAAGRLTKVSRGIGGTIRDFNIGYDIAGMRTSREVGLYRSKGKWKNLTASYGYDAANRLTSINHVNPLGAIEDFVYTYDPNGNRRSVTTSNAALLMAAPMSGTSYDEANEMLSHDDFDLVYDNNGNLTSKTNRVTLEATTYTWDARNRLVGISGPSVTASFEYDALNRRIEKTVNGVTTTFVYDGWDIIQETTDSVTTNYTRTLNIDEPLAFERTDGTIRYYVQDALGSVVALTDAEGLVTTTYEYDAFGAVTINGADDQPFQYTGRENDGTGLYCYRFRYYDPTMRRFISEDPIGLWGGINFYSYVGNSPLNWIDPYGLIDPSSVPIDMRNNIIDVINRITNRTFSPNELDNLFDKVARQMGILDALDFRDIDPNQIQSCADLDKNQQDIIDEIVKQLEDKYPKDDLIKRLREEYNECMTPKPKMPHYPGIPCNECHG